MTTTGTPAVSVVICAYTEDRWTDILAAVESVRRQTMPARETLLVIDHNPRLLERVRAEIPDVVAVENHEPRGLSGARNSGIAVAQGDLIAFLDDDAEAAPDWLEQLGRNCADPAVMGVGGRVDPRWLAGRPAWFPEEFYWVVGCTYRGLPAGTAAVRNLYGGCGCLRREVFTTVGGFRSGIGRVGTRPLGGEETELCIRVRQHWPQSTFVYEPRAKIDHRIPAQRARFGYFRSRCYNEGLSKAQIARFVGARDGLSAERAYTLRTLPQGVLRGLGDTVLRRDPGGLLRAGAIVAGLAFTTVGYLAGSLAARRSAPQAAGETVPIARQDPAL